jgi:hypothetical protein
MSIKSYLGKTFIVDDKEARIRQEKNLLQYVFYKEGDAIPQGKKVGDPKIIPQGTSVRVTNAKAIDNKLTFVFAEPAAEGETAPYGWTSAANLKGDFINETIGHLTPKDENKKGMNAAWDGGKYIGQKTLVEIVGNNNETERVILDNLDNYLAMVNAAAAEGILVSIRSGFRTYPEQEYLYKLYTLNPKKNALAAKPGYSNHQDGKAFDIDVGGFDGNPVYDWLKKNGPKFGFVRTVNREPWHWEYRPEEAAKLAAQGKFRTSNVKV